MKRPGTHGNTWQSGSSVFSNLVFLLILAYGIYVVVQYVPLALESSSVESMLNTIQDTQLANPILDEQDAEQKVTELLNINEMDDLKENFKFSESADSVFIDVNYQRELDLLFFSKTLNFNKSLTILKPRSY